MALQMSWKPSLLHHKRKIGPPLGLKNIGNSCYLNSVLQCLTYTPPLANFCLKNQHSSFCDSAAEPDRKRECPFCILEKRIARSLSIDQTLDTPSKMNSCLRIFAEHFRLGRQEDAHEFLRYVIDACHNTCLRLKKLQQLPRKGGGAGVAGANESSNGSTVVKEIFGGALQSQVKCLSCGGESNKVDEIMDISLDLLHSSSLKESLQKFFQAEVLDGNNKYKCENCKKLVAARKQMSLLQAPNVLVVQLKRFEGVFGGKIDKAIAFEEVLVLSSYMCKESQDTYPQYNLFGTIVHSGFSPDSGHYYAYIKDAMGHWYCCDDSIVKLSNLQEVLSEKVYILFFSRTKQRPRPANTALASNGVKSQECNGSDTSKSQKLAHSARAVYTEQSVDHSFEKDNLARSKDNGVLSSAQANLSSFGNCGTQKCTVTVNGKVDNLTRSKDNGVLSSAPVNLSSFGSSGTQKFTATVNGKIDNLTRSKDNGVLSSVQANLSSFGNSGTQKCTATVNGKVDNLNRSKDNGVLSSAPANLSSFGNSGTPMFTATVNGKIDVHKNQSNGKNGDVKASISTEKGEKNMSSLNGNGFTKSKTVEANGNGNSRAIPIANGNCKTKSTPGTSVEVGMPDDNHGRNGVKMGRVTYKHELKNGGVNCPSDISGSKRKLQDEDSCILFAKDAHSKAKLEELKEVLQKEAFSVLRSCGWTEEVSRAMCTRKKVCARETGDIASNSKELKKLLMTDAKRIFVSQIPESLKENLIKRLKLFSQEKQHSGP